MSTALSVALAVALTGTILLLVVYLETRRTHK